MLDIAGIGIGIVAATAATIGLIIAYLNRRDMLLASLPTIELYGPSTQCHFRLRTDEKSVGWKVIRVEVIESDWSNCIAQPVEERVTATLTEYPMSEWREFCDYPNGASNFAPIFIHYRCEKAVFSFVCVTPSRVWWAPWRRRKKRIPYNFVRHELRSIVEDPLLKC